MGKWKMVRLGDASNINMGQSPSSESYNDTGEGLPFFQGKTDFGLMYPTVRMYCRDPKKIAKENDILISVRAPVGAVNIAKETCCIGRGLAAISQNEKTNNYKYLYYYLQYKENDIANMGVGSTFKAISKRDLDIIEIPLPPLPVQQQIADVLDRASALIEKRKAQIEKLDLLIKSQFIEMFGDPVTNPKGWEIGAIRDLVTDVKYGTSKPAEENGQYVYLRMNNITYSGHIDLADLKYINVSQTDYEKYVVYKGDLLFNRTNSKELVGKTAVFKEDTPMIIAGYIIRVRTNEKANPEYISAFLNSQYGKELLFNMCKAIVGQANINAQELQTIKIPVAPISLQNRFASIVEQVEVQKKQLKKSLELLELNYKSLSQKCFSTEVFQ